MAAASVTGARSVESRISMVQQSVIKERYFDESDHCQICRLRGKRKIAGFFCTTCNMPLCNVCGDQHKATDVTNDHKVIPKKMQDGSTATCSIHRFAAVQFFCESCNQLICVNCTMIDHRQHNIIDIDSKVDKCKNELKDAVSELDMKILGFDRELKKISDIEIGIEHSRDTVKEEIALKVEELKSKLDKQHVALVDKLDGYLDGKVDHLNKRKEVIQRRFDEMMTVRVSADMAHRSGNVNNSEKFISDVVKIQRQVTEFKPPKEINQMDFTGIQFQMTNNEELGIMEETTKPLMISQGKKIKYAEKLEHVMLHPSNRKRGGVLRMSDNNREWSTMKIYKKFKTNTFLQNPSGIGVLPGRKYVLADAACNGLVICDESGRYQQNILRAEVTCPSGVAITKDGNIAVSTDKHVKIFKPGGIKVAQFHAPTHPGALQIDDHGNFIVSDNKSKHVTIYSPDGQPIEKFHTTDTHGNGPDPLNLAVTGNYIALSYQQYQIAHFVKIFSYKGHLLSSFRIPEACKGVQLDRFGNMIIASGDLHYFRMNSDRILPLMAVDKRGAPYKIQSRCVAFTNSGHICTIHVNPLSKRSEFLILQLGGNVTNSFSDFSDTSVATAKTTGYVRQKPLPPIENRPPSV